MFLMLMVRMMVMMVTVMLRASWLEESRVRF